MVVDSIVMTTYMSPFSKPLLDFDSMPKNSPPQTCFCTNVVHASLYEAIPPSKCSWLKLTCPRSHNVNM
jgi:hypothetical protein